MERHLKTRGLPEFRGRKHQTVTKCPFSSLSFPARRKRRGRRRRVRNDHDGTNPCKQGFLSSVLISSFPNRKLNLRFGFYGESAATSQALRASSPGRGAFFCSFFLCFLQKTIPAGGGAEKPAAQSAHLPAARARFARRRTKNAKLCTLPQAPPSSAGILCDF